MYDVQPHFKKQLFPASSSCGSTAVSIIASPYWRRGEVPGFLFIETTQFLPHPGIFCHST